eukprot:TRINITY_DN6451_c0_g4_i2.p1 TRINITY_DN6451_c0_g4~~TRINITY_DN6451_c0_g4_i2.p1  ORF type:complete len:220 (+),score=35.17 TRINITY_DN6451_c0_g4_i2:247-906(+)
MELSLLCGASIFMVVKEDSSNETIIYSSRPDIDLSSFDSAPTEKYTNDNYQGMFMEENKGSRKRLQTSKEMKAKPKFFIEKTPKKVKVVALQTFHEKVKQKALGLKISLDPLKLNSKPLNQDRPLSASPMPSMQASTNLTRPTPNSENEIISPVPVKQCEDSVLEAAGGNCYSGSHFSSFRPFEPGNYHSPLPFSGSCFVSYYNSMCQQETYKDYTDLM